MIVRGAVRTAGFNGGLPGVFDGDARSRVPAQGRHRGLQVTVDHAADPPAIARPDGLEDLAVFVDRGRRTVRVVRGEPGHAQLAVAQGVVQLDDDLVVRRG